MEDSLSEEQLQEHPLAKRFHALTPEQVLDVVEAQGHKCTGRFFILNSFENRVYQLEMDDGTTVVGKFYRPGRWSREAISEEHQFLQELQAEEIPVSVPVDLGDGQTIGIIQGIFYALFERVGGRSPEEPSDEQLRILGRYVARIHNVGARRNADHRPILNAETYGEKNLQYLISNDVIPPEVRELYSQTVEQLLVRIRPMFAGVPMHRIHGDCHLNNLLWSPNGATFLDFDDFLQGPAVQDIWLLAPSADEYGARQRDIIVEAYSQMRDFQQSWLSLVEPLRALRFIRYSTWIAKRWQDPIFQRTFPHFGSLVYWQREMQDLREQIARMDHFA